MKEHCRKKLGTEPLYYILLARFAYMIDFKLASVIYAGFRTCIGLGQAMERVTDKQAGRAKFLI